MIFLVSFEMLSQLSDTICQQRDLHFRRPGIRFMCLVPGNDLPLCFCHQCHLRVATPCLLFSRFCIKNSVTQCTAAQALFVVWLTGQKGNLTCSFASLLPSPSAPWPTRQVGWRKRSLL